MMDRGVHLIIRVIIFLLLGAMLNVGVAWSLHASVRPAIVSHIGPLSTSPSSPLFWSAAVMSKPGALTIDAEAWAHDRVEPLPQVPSWSATRKPPTALGQGIRESAYGWPFLSLYSRSNVGWTGRENPLPRTPIWRGMALNSILYGVVAWIAWIGFNALHVRSRWRIKRGQ